ncbi:MAG: DUF5107 domain-containing protein [Acidobacteriota bacterium]
MATNRLLLLTPLVYGLMPSWAQAPARVWEAPLVIPTYELGPADPNPVFPYARGRRPIYPYPALNSLTDRRVEKPYKAVYLENEYLKVTVLPELGGHLYSIFDKTANRDVLYTNHVVKYGMVAIRGAWVSGGIEWNFPDGHTVTTVSPIDYAMRAEADGSATVTVGDTERIQRMQWAVTVRLRPARKVVETEVRLNNRREVPGRYWFWATAAAQAADDMRFVYPMREAYPHVFWPVFSFPVHKGVDLGAYRAVPNALSLFARNSQRDFMGVYYEKSDWGVVHVADHREVPGKKTWTWGTADSGQIWVEKLTERDGQYVEFQAGRFETQMEHEFLAPHRVEHFTLHWYPVNRLGGPFTEANTEAALRVAPEGNRVRVAVNVNARFDDATLTLEADGVSVGSRRVSLSPTEPFTATFDLPANAAGRPLAVRVAGKDGRELIRYRSDTPLDGNPEFKPATRPVADPPASSSAEQAWVEGLAADKKSNELAARAAYERALQRDAGFAPARTALGLSYYRTGEYDKAAEHLTLALRRNPDAAEARYYLGLVRRAQGRAREAERELWWAVRAGYREPVARYVLGELALAAGDVPRALGHLSQAVLLDPRDLKARTVLAMAERLAGRLEDAQARIDGVVREMPVDYLALSEQHRILQARGRDAEARRAQDELWRLLAREPDSVLELAFDYRACGREAEAAAVLEEGLKRHRDHPMLAYTLGAARGSQTRGDAAFVFPHRVEEIAVLEAARKANPNDGRAAYYLGNALASKNRVAEAVSAWRDAVRLDPSNAVAHRNLGQAQAREPATRDEAVAAYERAIRAAPDDHHLYIELDRVLAAIPAVERRIKLLEGAPAAVRARAAVIQALAGAYVDAERFEQAARLLEGTQFVSGEGETSALALYRKAHWGLARGYQKAGQHEKAAAEILLAAEYRRNLGVGRPAIDSTLREWVEAARELELAGKREQAEVLWRKAAAAVVELASEPGGRESELDQYKAQAIKRLGGRK